MREAFDIVWQRIEPGVGSKHSSIEAARTKVADQGSAARTAYDAAVRASKQMLRWSVLCALNQIRSDLLLYIIWHAINGTPSDFTRLLKRHWLTVRIAILSFHVPPDPFLIGCAWLKLCQYVRVKIPRETLPTRGYRHGFCHLRIRRKRARIFKNQIFEIEGTMTGSHPSRIGGGWTVEVVKLKSKLPCDLVMGGKNDGAFLPVMIPSQPPASCSPGSPFRAKLRVIEDLFGFGFETVSYACP